jgi:hypothetical protein
VVNGKDPGMNIEKIIWYKNNKRNI